MPVTGAQLTWVVLILGFFGFSMLPVFLVLHLLLPKEALNKYFKPPHFSYRECAVFSAYPFFFMRTAMFMAVFAFPSKGKNRKITDAYLLAPNWYRIASKWFLIIFLGNMAIILILIAVLCVYMYFDTSV